MDSNASFGGEVEHNVSRDNQGAGKPAPLPLGESGASSVKGGPSGAQRCLDSSNPSCSVGESCPGGEALVISIGIPGGFGNHPSVGLHDSGISRKLGRHAYLSRFSELAARRRSDRLLALGPRMKRPVI
jgi:hypothetical protein